MRLLNLNVVDPTTDDVAAEDIIKDAMKSHEEKVRQMRLRSSQSQDNEIGESQGSTAAN